MKNQKKGNIYILFEKISQCFFLFIFLTLYPADFSAEDCLKCFFLLKPGIQSFIAFYMEKLSSCFSLFLSVFSVNIVQYEK